jgi:hypothetical protein
MEIQVPRSVDRERLLAPLRAGQMVRGTWVPLYELDSDYRKRITKRNPLRFALVYMPHALKSELTNNNASLSVLHVDMARAALRWEDHSRPWRDGWIAPRSAAKSTWQCLILPLWALAAGWRRFALLVAATTDQVQIQLGDFRRELDMNDFLREDYPELIPDRRARGNSDTADTVSGRGGATIAARGIYQASRGIKVASNRPDLIVLDDVEEDDDSDQERARRLRKILNVLLPMNERAAVDLVGTVTRWGSLSHAMVRAAIGDGEPEPWITGTGFIPRYYPAILPAADAEMGAERSLWPARWPLSQLVELREREPDNYALNYLGQPREPGGEHWTAASFRYVTWPTRDSIVHVDPAVTVTPDSDETAVCVIGSAVPRPGVQVVEYCRGRRVTGSQLRTWLVRLLRENQQIRTVVLEENAGGNWAETLMAPRVDGRDPWPAGVDLILYRAWEAKRDRLHTLEGRYERAEVVHRRMIPELERQFIRYPRVPHDDLIDTVAGGVEYVRNPHAVNGRGERVYRRARLVAA